MTELLIAYKTQIISIGKFITLPFLVFLICLAHVYLWGRMLGVVSGQIKRNIIAVATMFTIYGLYFFKVHSREDILYDIWNFVLYSSLSIIFYVNIGFKLYDRWESILDRWAKLPEPTKGKNGGKK